MKCLVCDELNVQSDHDISASHLKNKMLYEFVKCRKQLSGNRHGVIVSCSVKTSFNEVLASFEPKVKVSVKPNEEVTFRFTVKNDCNKADYVLQNVELGHNKLSFKLNKHGLSIGAQQIILNPKETFNKPISVSFISPQVGLFEVPVVFSLQKRNVVEYVSIIREVVVFVENHQVVHDKIKSPFTKKEVVAKNIIRTSERSICDDMYKIPKLYKVTYANNLESRVGQPPEQKAAGEDIRNVLETGVTEDNYERYFHNLLWYEETIARINLKNYNMSDVKLFVRGDMFELVVPGLAEKRPSLMTGDLLFVRPHDNEEVMFEGVIHEVRENLAVIKGIDHRFFSHYRFDATFDVRFFMSRLPLERMHQAVHNVYEDNLPRVFPKAPKKVPKLKPIVNYYNHLVQRNPEQAKAVQHIVAGTSGRAPYLLHGPPGTGKTITVVEAVLQLVAKNNKNRIMLCTDSNMAADHVATMLIKYTHMFQLRNFLMRCNSQYRVWESLPECLYKYSNGSDRFNFRPVNSIEFTEYSIVITTLSHAAKFAKDMRKRGMKRHITHLFIDEAAQASEPACLIPICGLLCPSGTLVLAGDPMQLGPVIISHGARRKGLGLSLMERLQKNCNLYNDKVNDPKYMVMLKNNFRSAKDVIEIPNLIFYNDQLNCMAPEDPISKVDILDPRGKNGAVVFHGVLSKEQRMGKSPSFFNVMELELVKQYITALVKKHNVQLADIGVVTPYIRQAHHIKNWLSENKYSKIEVGTVEAFQGKEKRIILISTVRANADLLAHDAKFQLGFLVDDKRFNVAITRAKAKVIVIGNPLCLQRDAKWRQYMEQCHRLGTYRGFNAKPNEVNKDDIDKITPLVKKLAVENKSRE